VFRPLSVEEITPLLPAQAADGLQPGRVYGIHWPGRRRSKFKSTKGKVRTVYMTPSEEWVPIPIDLTSSELDRAAVDRARALVAQNRASASVGDRFWELSGGILKCGECGRNMIAYRRRTKQGGYNYYRCRPSSTLDVCANRKSHPALDLEHRAASMFEWEASYETMVELYDRAVEEQSAGFAEELRVVDDEAETARRLKTARYSLIHSEWYEDPEAIWPRELLTSGSSPEQVRAAYARFGGSLHR
jgi:hypothetical protein